MLFTAESSSILFLEAFSLLNTISPSKKLHLPFPLMLFATAVFSLFSATPSSFVFCYSQKSPSSVWIAVLLPCWNFSTVFLSWSHISWTLCIPFLDLFCYFTGAHSQVASFKKGALEINFLRQSFF